MAAGRPRSATRRFVGGSGGVHSGFPRCMIAMKASTWRRHVASTTQLRHVHSFLARHNTGVTRGNLAPDLFTLRLSPPPGGSFPVACSVVIRAHAGPEARPRAAPVARVPIPGNWNHVGFQSGTTGLFLDGPRVTPGPLHTTTRSCVSPRSDRKPCPPSCGILRPIAAPIRRPKNRQSIPSPMRISMRSVMRLLPGFAATGFAAATGLGYSCPSRSTRWPRSTAR